MSVIFRNVVNAVVARGLTPREIALAFGVSAGTVRDWMAGTRAPHPVMQASAVVHFEWLLAQKP